VNFTDHDFVASSLARETLAAAHAAAARHRRLGEARRAREDRMRRERRCDLGVTLARLPTPERISGVVALAIQPDAATIATSYALAAELMPAAPVQALAPGSLPHVTLTQCALLEAPRARVRELTARLDDRLRGRRIPLGAVVTFGAGFLFWCAEPDGPERTVLQEAHERAVTLADGVLDPVANRAVIEATRQVFGDDPVLVSSTRACGYSLARERYLPHITLGFDPRLEEGARLASRPSTMTVERVILARLGAYGRLEAELSLE
jgi:hypothetical protein